MRPVRIATWNVNSLKARLEKVSWWLERARPDVLLMQETKLADPEAPTDAFRSAGYALAHHGEGRWNGVAIASRCGIEGVVTNFGEPRLPLKTPDVGDDEPLAEARMISAACGGVRVVCVYAPNGRVLGSTASPAGSPRRLIRASPSCSAATSTWRPRTATCGILRPVTAAPTSPARSERPSPGSAAGGSSTRTGGNTPSPVDTPGGTTGPGNSTGTSACASTTCW